MEPPLADPAAEADTACGTPPSLSSGARLAPGYKKALPRTSSLAHLRAEHHAVDDSMVLQNMPQRASVGSPGNSATPAIASICNNTLFEQSCRNSGNNTSTSVVKLLENEVHCRAPHRTRMSGPWLEHPSVETARTSEPNPTSQACRLARAHLQSASEERARFG